MVYQFYSSIWLNVCFYFPQVTLKNTKVITDHLRVICNKCTIKHIPGNHNK